MAPIVPQVCSSYTAGPQTTAVSSRNVSWNLPPNSRGDTGAPGGPGPAGQDLRRRVFYQRPRRPWEDARGDCVPGVGLGHRGHVTAQPERDGARRAGTKVSVTRVPVAGESHVWLCQNSAVSVPVAETWVHMDSGPAAGTHGCVVTAPTTPCAHQVLSLSLPWLLRAAVCRRVKRGRSALQVCRLTPVPFPLSLCWGRSWARS